jgi:hypothetical protein
MSKKSNIEMKLRQIVSGFFHIKFKNKLFKFFEPTNALYSEVAFHTESLYEDLKAEGFLTEEEEEQILKDRGLWSDEKEKNLKQMQQDLEKLLSERHKYKYQSKAIASIDKAIKTLEESIKQLLDIRGSLFYHTIEYQKSYRTNVILISECLRNRDDTKVWSSFEELENNVSASEIDELIVLTSKNRCTTSEIRKMARTEPWRTVWKTACKTSGNIFNKAITDITKSQYELCYWSNVYDSVYESSDYPGQEVIDNDEMLDDWFILQAEKYGKSKKENSEFTQNKKIANASEVFMVVDTPDDAKKVYSELNTSKAEEIIKKRMAKIDEKGNVAEHEFADVQQNMQIELNKLNSKAANGKR